MQISHTKHRRIWLHTHNCSGVPKPRTPVFVELDNPEKNSVSCTKVVKFISANSATLSESQMTSKKLRPKEKVPKPKIPEWPQPEWPQDLCLEFKDVLMEELECTQQVNCPPLDVELQQGTKPFFAQ